MIESIIFPTLIRPLSILAVKEGVVNISFSNVSFADIRKWFRNHLIMEVVEENDFTNKSKRQILKYFSGKR